MRAARIRPEEVLERMSRGERVLFVDTRSEKAWQSSDRKLPGAVRIAPDAIDAAVGDLPRGKLVVAYCT